MVQKKKNDFYKLLTIAKSLELNVIGVSFHVGSGCYDLGTYEQALNTADRVFKIGEQLGFSMTMLDIGGGFPGSWSARGDDGSGVTFPKIASKMQPLIDEMFPKDKVRIIAEPGRYFVASSHTLAVNIIGIRKFDQLDSQQQQQQQQSTSSSFASSSPPKSSTILLNNNNNNNINNNNNSNNNINNKQKISYYVNDGVYGSFNNIMYDHAHPTPVPLNKEENNQQQQQQQQVDYQYCSTIFGPTCDGLDCIIKDYYLPELVVGDWIYFREMGAYTKAAASQFNGFDLTKSFYYLSSQEFLC